MIFALSYKVDIRKQNDNSSCFIVMKTFLIVVVKVHEMWD